MDKQTKQKRQRGFSLLELLVVMIILGFVAFLAGPRLFDSHGKARQKTARTQIDMLMAALESFRLDMGRYPTQQEGLVALVANPGNAAPPLKKWDGPYLKKALPNDPWGNPYQYRNPGKHGEVDIYSTGQNSQPDGEKEGAVIGSWE